MFCVGIQCSIGLHVHVLSFLANMQFEHQFLSHLQFEGLHSLINGLLVYIKSMLCIQYMYASL